MEVNKKKLGKSQSYGIKPLSFEKWLIKRTNIDLNVSFYKHREYIVFVYLYDYHPEVNEMTKFTSLESAIDYFKNWLMQAQGDWLYVKEISLCSYGRMTKQGLLNHQCEGRLHILFERSFENGRWVNYYQRGWMLSCIRDEKALIEQYLKEDNLNEYKRND